MIWKLHTDLTFKISDSSTEIYYLTFIPKKTTSGQIYLISIIFSNLVHLGKISISLDEANLSHYNVDE